ncbi:MAG: hypothetical protein JWP63_2791 [Candidatus Solibacter sp.]|jgi:hypothetical protein|nr:hypothetical protein [Candidatus Solibacter sp.]
MDEKTTTGSAAGGHVHDAGCFFCTTAMPMLERVWTEATRDHFRHSRVEFLKGLRSLIDERIDHLSRHEDHKGTKVTVE